MLSLISILASQKLHIFENRRLALSEGPQQRAAPWTWAPVLRAAVAAPRAHHGPTGAACPSRVGSGRPDFHVRDPVSNRLHVVGGRWVKSHRSLCLQLLLVKKGHEPASCGFYKPLELSVTIRMERCHITVPQKFGVDVLPCKFT